MFSVRIRLIILGVAVIFTAVLVQLSLTRHPSNTLKVSFLNIGQGDAIYIEAPNKRQVIVDGGPNDALSGELASVVPFGDTTIDMLIVTNPDTDHYHGFINLLDNYNIGAVIVPGTFSKTSTWKLFTDKIDAKNIPVYLAHAGQTIMLDPAHNVGIKILFPDRNVSSWTSNDGSIMSILTYGKSAVMLTGDATAYTESLILDRARVYAHDETILKAGHHGSRTSTSRAFVSALAPELAVVSAGDHNSYGHPHKETLDTFAYFHIPYFLTARDGRVTCSSKGFAFMCE